ncbi:MAG: ABC transporter ATP-binding protein [Candidatus Limnocylindrales bacterium]
MRVVHRGAERPAVDGVSFDLEPGSALLVVGPSGSGKSTLAMSLAGLIPGEIPAVVSGRLELDGIEVSNLGPVGAAARVGLVLQDPAAQLVMERVEDDVAFGLENRGWPVPAMRARVPEALAGVGLAGMERRRSRQLSGGQQQRLALAGSLAPRPGLLILDEPTANLDPEGAAALMAALTELRAERSTTIVLIEHRVDAAWPLADVVLALGADGEQIDVGPAAEVARRSGASMAAAGTWLPASVERQQPVSAFPGGTAAPPGPGTEVVGATDLRFAYEPGWPVLRDVSISASEGERIVLVGANGSGKSTLGRLLVGLLRPDRGTVRLGGDDPARLGAADLARRAGYVFQDPERQFLAERVGDEVTLGLTAEERARVPDLMARLDLPLDRFAERSPYRLSGGEQRRLSLACILVRRPRVLVLDEPTFGQDRRGYASLLGILGEHVDQGTCLIAATHDERFVRDVAGRIVELDEGWVVRDSAVGS